MQVYGGYGYSAEYPVERYYRDSRVNRIFEGTNEINRLLIPGMLLKRAATDRLPLNAAVRAVVDEVMSASMPSEASGAFGAGMDARTGSYTRPATAAVARSRREVRQRSGLKLCPGLFAAITRPA